MSPKSKMFGVQKHGDEEESSPLPTIVGGRPPEQQRVLQGLPSGIQKLLMAASLDPTFKEKLIASPGDAARAAELALTPSESAILLAVPPAQLRTMIEQLFVANPDRRDFLERSAGAVLAVAAGAALDACTPKTKKPAVRDEPAGGNQMDVNPTWPSPPGGIQPDRINVDGGIRTDRTTIGGILSDRPITRGTKPDRP